MGRNSYTKIYPDVLCGFCGKKFTPKIYNQKYCCNDCRVQKQIKEYKAVKSSAVYSLHCRVCGKTFQSSNPKTAYCSSECRNNKPKDLMQKKIQRRFVFVGDNSKYCPNPKCNWRLDCGGGKAVCLRAKCNNGVVFT